MTQTLPNTQQDEPRLSRSELEKIADLVKKEAGLDVIEMAEALVFSRLTRRLRATGCRDFPAYLALVHSDAGGDERTAMIEALTTNITRFYREPAHFRILAEQVLPGLRARAVRGARVRLWSAGCSTGEEAYTMAAIILNGFPEATNHDIRILATDINRRVLKEAETGIYSEERLDGLPGNLREILFSSSPHDENSVKVRDSVKALVTFRQLNLVSEWPLRGPFDVIFCRNVAIYMDQPTQWQLWSRMERVLDPEGMLFIGHSERLGPDLAGKLLSCGPTSYCRGSSVQMTKEAGSWH